MSGPKVRWFNPAVIIGLIAVAVFAAVVVAEPASFPYRLSAALTGAVFGAIGGGLGAAIEYLIKRRFSTAFATVGVVLGFVLGQIIENSAGFLGDRVYDSAVRPQVDRAVVRRTLSQNPLFQKINEVDASAYERLVTGVVDRMESGAKGPEIEAYTQQYTADFRRQNAERALSASPAAMAAIIRSLRDIIVYLESVDPTLCSDYVFAGISSPRIRALANKPDFFQLIQGNAVAVFAAIADGKVRNLIHSIPTDADVQLVVRSLDQMGWTLEMRESLASPDRMRQLPPRLVCRLNKEWLSALLSVRDERAQGRWYREVLGPLLKS
jgi:hypothetical protein